MKPEGISGAIARVRRDDGWSQARYKRLRAAPLALEADAADAVLVYRCSACGEEVGQYSNTYPCDRCNEWALPVGTTR